MGRETIVTAPLPRLLIRRGLRPGMISRVIVQKFRFGMPLLRQEAQVDADDIALDRGTMARTVEDVGASLGPIVLAMVHRLSGAALAPATCSRNRCSMR